MGHRVTGKSSALPPSYSLFRTRLTKAPAGFNLSPQIALAINMAGRTL